MSLSSRENDQEIGYNDGDGGTVSKIFYGKSYSLKWYRFRLSGMNLKYKGIWRIFLKNNLYGIF